MLCNYNFVVGKIERNPNCKNIQIHKEEENFEPLKGVLLPKGPITNERIFNIKFISCISGEFILVRAYYDVTILEVILEYQRRINAPAKAYENDLLFVGENATKIHLENGDSSKIVGEFFKNNYSVVSVIERKSS